MHRRSCIALYWPITCTAARLLTFSREDSDADARVTQFYEGGVSGPPVILSDQKDVFGADVAVNEMLLLLRSREKKDGPVEEKQLGE